jgi:uncharacterized membrane protein
MLEEVKEEVKSNLASFFSVYRMRKIGFILGFLIGIVILVLGPFKTFFIFFCGVIGLYIGSRFDDGDDLVGRTLKAIEHMLPKRFQR